MDLKELQKIAPKEGHSRFIYDEVTRLRWYEGYTPQSDVDRKAELADKAYTLGELLLATAAYASAQGLDLQQCLDTALRIDREGLTEEEEDDGGQTDE